MDLNATTAAAIAVILTLVLSFLLVTGKQIPELLNTLTSVVFGFYFGNRARNGRPASSETARKPRARRDDAE